VASQYLRYKEINKAIAALHPECRSDGAKLVTNLTESHYCIH
jgi:hypothetical protein